MMDAPRAAMTRPIDTGTAALAAPRPQTAASAGAHDFAALLTTPARPAAAAPGPAAIGIVEPAADTPAPAELSDREARRHGRALLQALARLQQALLGGSAELALALNQLEQLGTETRPPTDAELNAALRAIRQRAAIEVARGEGRPGALPLDPVKGHAL